MCACVQCLTKPEHTLPMGHASHSLHLSPSAISCFAVESRDAYGELHGKQFEVEDRVVDPYSLLAAVPAFRASAPVSSESAAADPYQRSASSSGDPLFERIVDQQQPEVWPYGDAEADRRWARQAEAGIERDLRDAIEADPPFREGRNDAIIDENGRRIVWPWESSSSFEELPRLPPHRSDALVQRGINASTVDGQMGRSTTGVKAWHLFCEAEGLSASRALDSNASLERKLLEEQLCMRFCATIVQDRAIAPKTMATYFGQVQGWHGRAYGVKLCAGLKLNRLPAMLKGLRRILGDESRAVRRGIAPQALSMAFERVLDPANPVHANIRAALALALQGLLRGSEFAIDEGKTVDFARHLTRKDVRVLTREQLVVMMLPCKNMRHLNGKTVPLAIGAGGQFIDAVWEMNNLLRVDPTPEGKAATTPLFRDPATNTPLRTGYLRKITAQLLISIGLDSRQFGLHSYRIGGATALFAAGATPMVIRTMGRWSSDCYRLYVRACFEQTLSWSRACGSTVVNNLAGQFEEVDFY